MLTVGKNCRRSIQAMPFTGLQVADTGIGISPEFLLQNSFCPLKGENWHQNQAEGTGLGLVISKIS